MSVSINFFVNWLAQSSKKHYLCSEFPLLVREGIFLSFPGAPGTQMRQLWGCGFPAAGRVHNRQKIFQTIIRRDSFRLVRDGGVPGFDGGVQEGEGRGKEG